MIDTKQKILATAEHLFGEQGYAGTSLRQIIAEAGVNIAAVHYHFGSKEELLDELMVRRVGPVNEQRLAMLARFEAESSPDPLPVVRIFEAFLLPISAVAGETDFARLMGRMHGEGMMPAIIRKHFQPVVTRFVAALRRSLPDLPEEDLLWRMHFMIGAMAHGICARPVFPLPEPATTDLRRRLELLVSFLGGAFLAAPTPEREIGAEK